LTNDQAYPASLDVYESLQRETRNRQQLMIFSIAPFVEAWRVSTQKLAEGAVTFQGQTPFSHILKEAKEKT
jgi:hypothetical protein